MCIRDSNNGIKYLPVVENYDDNYKMNNKIITYHTDVDRTIPDLDLIYNKPIEIVNEIYKMFDNYYNDYNNISYSLNNKINRPKIRMLFNDGG